MATDHDSDHVEDPGAAEAIHCADCAASDSAVEDLDPIDTMPIPAEALDGFADGVPRQKGHDRRTFIRNGAIGLASIYAATQIDWTRAFEAAVAEGAEPGTSVVMIFLNGGIDGLNTIVPLPEYGIYADNRPGLARVQGPSSGNQVGLTPLANAGSFAWANVGISGAGNNGDTKGFDTLWGNGDGSPGSDLAIFPSTNYTPANRSHFDSRDYWFSGALEKSTTGWLGRWLDQYGSLDNPLQAISMGSRLSKQIRTLKAPVSAVRNLNGVEFKVNGVYSGHTRTTEQMAPVSAVKAGSSNEALKRARDVYGRTVQVSRSLQALQGAPVAAGYPPGRLSRDLQLAAVLLGANLGTRIITVDWGSFDTHGNQANSLDPQLSTLSRALAAFKDDLVGRGLGDKVLTVVFSEFGRRVKQNATGTDHGNGGLMMAMGSRVNGGMSGDWPGLSTLSRGDLRPTTDFRSVYGAIMTEWLGGDPNAVLPKGPFPGLPRKLIS